MTEFREKWCQSLENSQLAAAASAVADTLRIGGASARALVSRSVYCGLNCASPGKWADAELRIFTSALSDSSVRIDNHRLSADRPRIEVSFGRPVMTGQSRAEVPLRLLTTCEEGGGEMERWTVELENDPGEMWRVVRARAIGHVTFQC